MRRAQALPCRKSFRRPGRQADDLPDSYGLVARLVVRLTTDLTTKYGLPNRPNVTYTMVLAVLDPIFSRQVGRQADD